MDYDIVESLDTAKVVASPAATMRGGDVDSLGPAGTVVSEDGACVVVLLLGEHDAASSGALASTLSGALDAAGSGLVVDLSGVRFMGAATIGVVCRA